MKNNLTDKKIIKMIKEDYELINPSSELKEKIKHSYQSYHTSKNDEKNSIIINFLQMFRVNKIALSAGALAVIIIGGITFYLFQDSKNELAIKDVNSIVVDEKVDDEADKIIEDLDEDLDDLTLLVQAEDVSTASENSNSDATLDDINTDDLDNALDGLDEIGSILDEDVFGDDLF